VDNEFHCPADFVDPNSTSLRRVYFATCVRTSSDILRIHCRYGMGSTFQQEGNTAPSGVAPALWIRLSGGRRVDRNALGDTLGLGLQVILSPVCVGTVPGHCPTFTDIFSYRTTIFVLQVWHLTQRHRVQLRASGFRTQSLLYNEL
jgi:hypothetical protein